MQKYVGDALVIRYVANRIAANVSNSLEKISQGQRNFLFSCELYIIHVLYLYVNLATLMETRQRTNFHTI